MSRPTEIAAEKAQRAARKAAQYIEVVKEAGYQHGLANGRLSGAGEEQKRIVEIIDARLANAPHQTHVEALGSLRAELTHDWTVRR